MALPPQTVPASTAHWLQKIGTGGSDTFGGAGTVDTTSSPYQLSAPQLAQVLNGNGDFIMRARCQPSTSFKSDIGSDRYYFAWKDIGNNETSLRYSQAAFQWIFKVKGVDQTDLASSTNNGLSVLTWDAGHEVVLWVWYCRSLGFIAFRFEINGCVNSGWQFAEAGLPGIPNYVDYFGFLAATAVVVGSKCRPTGGSLWWLYVSQTNGTSGTNEPGVVGGLPATANPWPQTEGATIVDNGGITWKATRDATGGGPVLATPTLFNLGSDLAGGHNFAAVWDQLQFSVSGTGFQPDSAGIIHLGDSNDTSFRGYAPTAAYSRSIAESRTGLKRIILSHPGVLVSDQTNCLNGVNLSGLYEMPNQWAKYPFAGAIIEGGVNDVQFSHTTAQIRTDYQALITLLGTNVPGIKIIAMRMTPADKTGGPVHSNLTQFNQQNADLAGGFYTGLTVVGPFQSTLDGGAGVGLLATYNTPDTDGLHMNNSGRAVNGGASTGYRAQINTAGLAP